MVVKMPSRLCGFCVYFEWLTLTSHIISQFSRPKVWDSLHMCSHFSNRNGVEILCLWISLVFWSLIAFDWITRICWSCELLFYFIYHWFPLLVWTSTLNPQSVLDFPRALISHWLESQLQVTNCNSLSYFYTPSSMQRASHGKKIAFEKCDLESRSI